MAFSYLTNCTLGGNSCGTGGAANIAGLGPFPPGGAGGSGGGICCYYTNAIAVACTIAGNTTGLGGAPGRGAAGVDGTGGGIYAPQSDASFSLLDDIVALNSAINAAQGPDVYGAFNSLGHNLIGATNDSSGLIAPGNLTGSRASPLNPKLGPLADNGGPTLTMALLPGSPAIDAGDTAAAPPDRSTRGPAAILAGGGHRCVRVLAHLAGQSNGVWRTRYSDLRYQRSDLPATCQQQFLELDAVCHQPNRHQRNDCILRHLPSRHRLPVLSPGDALSADLNDPHQALERRNDSPRNHSKK